MLSTELRLALSPASTYRALAAARADATWRATFASPAFSLLLIGVLVSIIATGRVTLPLVGTLALSWAFAVLIQALAAAVIVGSSGRRAVSRRRAFELLFLAHAPWSLWLLGVTALSLWSGQLPANAIFAATILVPIAWTAVLLSAFCREVLGTGRRGARLRTLAHQAIVWGCAVQFAAMVAGSWNRLIQGLIGW